jgi:hypothetical protein
VATIIYDDPEPHTHFRGFRGTPNPHKNYVKHVQNWFYLKFVLSKTPSITDKFQATKELAICERKLDYWYRQPSFDPKEVEKDLRDLKATWGTEFKLNDFDATQRKWLAQYDRQTERAGRKGPYLQVRVDPSVGE